MLQSHFEEILLRDSYDGLCKQCVYYNQDAEAPDESLLTTSVSENWWLCEKKVGFIVRPILAGEQTGINMSYAPAQMTTSWYNVLLPRLQWMIIVIMD